MKEMDLLLLRYLEHVVTQDPAQVAIFSRLLDTEDDQLWRWLLGHANSPETDIAQLIANVRAFALT